MPDEAPTKLAEQVELAASKKRVSEPSSRSAKLAGKPPTKSAAPPKDSRSAGIGAQWKAKKADKPRPPLVRDRFTMPEADFALLARLKSTAIGERRAAKKSELLRAGWHALAASDAQALIAALDPLEAVKTGRPRKGR